MTPWVKRLIIANALVFLFMLPFGARLAVDWLAFTPSRILVRPWGPLTYMFVHGGFWHLFWNMLILFFFGPPLEQRWGSREFIRYYLLCGLGGAALSFIFMNAPIVGASAAVFGVMVAFAMNWPNSPIYIWGIFPVKAKWLVGFLFVADLLSALSGNTGGIAVFAHLGGALTGFAYMKGDWRLDELMNRARKKTRLRRFAVVSPDGSPGEEEDDGGGDEREPSEEEALLDAVDQVLDKISARGMSSLTPDERRLLDEVSRRRRSN